MRRPSSSMRCSANTDEMIQHLADVRARPASRSGQPDSATTRDTEHDIPRTAGSSPSAGFRSGGQQTTRLLKNPHRNWRRPSCAHRSSSTRRTSASAGPRAIGPKLSIRELPSAAQRASTESLVDGQRVLLVSSRGVAGTTAARGYPVDTTNCGRNVGRRRSVDVLRCT
jgi:hypothetical protein